MSEKKQLVDLRSDTVTRPTATMRKAMSEAQVGDDVYGEDPTVNRLQQHAAELFDREAALFVPSGCMGNLICMRLHGGHGGEVICDARGHVFNFELGSVAAIGGMLARPVETPDGHLTWDRIAPKIPPKAYYRAQTRVIVLENTHNMAGGTLMPDGVQQEVCARARERGLKVHLDGARIFNASVATGKTVAELSRGADSVMFSLSKGLGAPVGALVLGSAEFIEEARVYRKMFGGGMRQSGVLGAAGLVALDQSVSGLAQDHKNARKLATGLAEITRVEIDLATVQTNILVFDLSATGLTAPKVSDGLKERGVLASALDESSMRMVTHYDVDEDGVEAAIRSMREVVEKVKAA